MPFVDIEVKDDVTFSFRYSIATPSLDSAENVVSELPCIIFIHSCYISQEVFELQFADPFLRQFNLIAIDMRGCGETRGFIGEGRYTPAESASDVGKIIKKLKLPSCHLFGLSNGGCVALELAIARPDLVLSVTICSPLPPVEPPEIYAGRMEVLRYWKEMEESLAEASTEQSEAEELANEVIIGSVQLLYNHADTDIVRALCSVMLKSAKENWCGSPEKELNGYKANIEWILERRADIGSLYSKSEQLTQSTNMQIKVPVNVIHCSEDVAYPLEHAEELVNGLRKMQVSQVSLHQVSGPHFANVTNPQSVNKILHDAMVACHPELVILEAPYSIELAKRARLQTPFTDCLVESHGYDPFDDLSDE